MNKIIEMLTEPLVLPIMIALLAGAVAYLCSRHLPIVCKLLALGASTAVLLAGVSAAGGSAEVAWTWLELTEEISFDINLATTPLGMLVLIGSAAFALLITVYSLSAMAGRHWEGKFYAYLIWALAGATPRPVA